MRRISPRAHSLVLFGGVLLLSLLGGVAGVISFLLLRAGYSFLVWGLLPFVTLLLVALAFGAVLWWAAGGALPGTSRSDGSGETPREDSPPGEQPGGGAWRGDDV